GKAADDTVQTDLQEEIDKRGDILYVDSIDTYRNNTRKFVHSILFGFEPGNGCQSPEFVLLIDDDYMVHIGGLLHHLSEENHSLHLYEGWMFNTSPFRFRLHKHSVSLKLYPFDRYPPYISAGAVLMSRNTVAHFYYALQFVRIYPFDDIYAGILAYLLQIHPRHNEAFVFWTRTINAEEWKRGDVLVAHGYSPDQMIHEYNDALRLL
ncbi:N-acetyllactosaminide 3-alpha-galactosyltransferase, partial [Ostertagia ostertagi]